jgi:hypothetical protein
MNKFVLAILAGFLANSTVYAEDRALIMGLGSYANPRYNLIGIEHDINTMQETAKLMGFESVKVLQNEQITKENVEKTVQSWLINGLKPQDRVLIYFSGHGSTVPDTSGDEDDGIDEVLTTYTVGEVNKKTGNSLDGVLIDDDFNALLHKIPSNNILVLLDSCHSGTATRSLNGSMMSKALRYEGMPKPKKTRSLSKKPIAQQPNIVTIGAANDDEESLSMVSGGLFTTGFNKILEEAIAQKKSLTPVEMRKKVDEYIQKRINTFEYKPFHPKVSGDEKLINTPFILAGVNDTVRPDESPVSFRAAIPATTSTTAWADLVTLASQTKPLDFVTNKIKLTEGENLTLQTNTSETGYLHLLAVDADDNVTLLFPNQKQPDNVVSTGSFVFPNSASGFNLTVKAPFGKSLVVALFSKEKLNLYQGETHFLKVLSKEEIKKLFTSPITSAGQLEIISCKNETNCQ